MPSSGGQTCALRSEEHTSELQSLTNLVCRLLLEKKHQPPQHHAVPLPLHPLLALLFAPRRPPQTGLHGRVTTACDGRPGRDVPFFFFKGTGAPRVQPSSPTRPFPN